MADLPPTKVDVVTDKKKSISTFNVSDFRSKLDSLGGVSRSTLYRVEIIIPDAIKQAAGKIDLETLTFLVASVSFPGVRFTTQSVQRYGIGPAEEMPTGVISGSCTMNILCDADGHILRFLRAWTRGIVEYQSTRSDSLKNDVFPNMKPFHVNYKKNIETQISIPLYNSSGDQVYKVSLTKAFPTDISQTYLSWANTDQVLYVPVIFSYYDMAFDLDGGFNPSEASGENVLSVVEKMLFAGASIQTAFNVISLFTSKPSLTTQFE